MSLYCTFRDMMEVSNDFHVVCVSRLHFQIFSDRLADYIEERKTQMIYVCMKSRWNRSIV